MMSFFSVPKEVLKKLDYFIPRFFFGKVTTKEGSITLPSGVYYVNLRTRGVRIHDLEMKNVALLSKWLFKLLTTDGIWQ
jgi:chloramphenicol O-acetyltransferase